MQRFVDLPEKWYGFLRESMNQHTVGTVNSQSKSAVTR